MKAFKLSAIILSLLLFTNSCKKDAFHSIRFKNNFIEEVNHIKVGDVPFGTVEVGETSSYSAVELGTHKISGTTPTGYILSGSITIEGSGETPKWTVIFNNDGSISYIRDL